MAKKSKTSTPKKKTIIVIGDYMIDQTWLLAGLPSPTAQVHANVVPLKRVHPTWNCQRLGGAGMSYMALRASMNLRKDDYRLVALGIWKKEDENLIKSLAEEGFASPCHPEFYNLDLLAADPNDPGTHRTTIWKTRYATHLADDRPELFARYDQDPNYAYRFANDPIDSFKKQSSLDPSDVAAVFVSDFRKGAVVDKVLQSLVAWLGKDALRAKWLCDSKGTEIIQSLPKNARAMLSVNRDEIVNLAYGNPVDRLPIPHRDQPNVELLTAIRSGINNDRFATSENRVTEIYVKLDSEGAALFKQNTTGEYDGTYCSSGKSVDSDGIAAGDFFNAALLLDVLSGNTELKKRLSAACSGAAAWLDFSATYWKDLNLRSSHRSDIIQAGFYASCKETVILAKKRTGLQSFTDFDLNTEFEQRMALHDYTKIKTKIKKFAAPQIALADSTGFLGDFGSTDPILRRDISDFVEQVNSYTKRVGSSRPLNCLVVASPGSGKSFFAGQVAKTVGCELVEVNCSQMYDGRELLRAVACLQNVSEEKTPLLFLDEVDAREDFYPMLLAPLWDAEAIIDGDRRRWRRKAVTILVASSVRDPDDFIDHLRKSGVSKGPDLASRLKGPQLALSERSRDPASLTNRVYMMASMLLRHHRGGRFIHQGIPDLLYSARQFNARALEQFVLSLDPPTNGVLQLRENKPAHREKLEQFACDLGYNVGTNNDLLLDPSEVAGLKSLGYKVSISANKLTLTDFMDSSELVEPGVSGYIRIRE